MGGTGLEPVTPSLSSGAAPGGRLARCGSTKPNPDLRQNGQPVTDPRGFQGFPPVLGTSVGLGPNLSYGAEEFSRRASHMYRFDTCPAHSRVRPTLPAIAAERPGAWSKIEAISKGTLSMDALV